MGSGTRGQGQAAAKQAGIALKQTFAKEGRDLNRKAGHYVEINRIFQDVQLWEKPCSVKTSLPCVLLREC